MLNKASYEGHESVVKLLLQNEANINARNNDGSKALQLGFLKLRPDFFFLV